MFDWKNKTPEQIANIVSDMHPRLVERRQTFEDLQDIITKIFRPRRQSMLGMWKKGKQYGARIYSQVPSNSLHRHVGGKIGYMVNRAVPWIQFITPNHRLMKLDHIKEYCQTAAEQVLYATNRSNFYSMVYPHTLDADSIGTSVVIPFEDEEEDRIFFDVVHPRNSYIAIDAFGKPAIYHRELRLTRMTAEEICGENKLPTTWYKKNEDGTTHLKQPLQEDAYIWAIYKNGDKDHDSLLTEDKRYLVFMVLKSAQSGTNDKLVYMKGRDQFVICTRPGRDSGSEYGTSISADCLTAALVTNKLEEKSIDAAHKHVDPAVIASSTLRATLSTKAGGRTWVDDINREGAKTWMDKSNWPITDAQMQRLIDQIEKRMFLPIFELLSSGEQIERTAYEVSQLQGEKATLMSTVVDTFEQETLIPSLQTIISAETDANRMPPVPDEILVTGGRIDIEFLGPLAQLQRSLLRSKGTIDALSLIERIMSMNEQAGWKIDWMEMIEEVTIAQGMPQRLIKSDEEVAMIAESVAAQQKQAMEMEQLKISAKASSDLAQRVEPRSPMSQLMGPQQEATG